MSKVLTPLALPELAPVAPARPRAPVVPAQQPPARTQPERTERRQPARPDRAVPALWANLRSVAPPPAPVAPDPLVAARAEAEAILAAARQDAERLRARTEARAAAEGRRRARAQARTDLRHLTRRARAILGEVRALRERAAAELGDEVVETTIALVRAVLARRAEQGGDDLRDLARRIIAEARDPKRLLANPADGAALDGLGVPVESDPDIARGGFRLFAADGEHDARLERRIARLEDALREEAARDR